MLKNSHIRDTHHNTDVHHSSEKVRLGDVVPIVKAPFVSHLVAAEARLKRLIN